MADPRRRSRPGAALTARKTRGARLGSPTNAPEAAALGREVLVSEADRFAANVLPVIRSIQATGVTDLVGIADALNALGIPTARGGRWHVSTVRNVLRRRQLRALLGFDETRRQLALPFAATLVVIGCVAPGVSDLLSLRRKAAPWSAPFPA